MRSPEEMMKAREKVKASISEENFMTGNFSSDFKELDEFSPADDDNSTCRYLDLTSFR